MMIKSRCRQFPVFKERGNRMRKVGRIVRFEPQPLEFVFSRTDRFSGL